MLFTYRELQDQLKDARDNYGYELKVKLNAKYCDLLAEWCRLADEQYEACHCSGVVYNLEDNEEWYKQDNTMQATEQVEKDSLPTVHIQVEHKVVENGYVVGGTAKTTIELDSNPLVIIHQLTKSILWGVNEVRIGFCRAAKR